MSDPVIVAESFSVAYPAGDLATVRGLFAADAVIWHNFDRREQTLADDLAMIEALVGAGHVLRYDDIRRRAFRDACVHSTASWD